MQYHIFIVLFIFLSVFKVQSQQYPDTFFHRPLDIPVLLSGTFAELRPNHFHSGIDYRTQGVIGHKVYASESGYVSRIFVGPGGYGKAIYLTHPNGYTTVYGHLEDFYDEVSTYVKQQQYKREQFRVDLYPDSNRFIIKRGQVIGLSGNTGGSTGPHLHYEVRETKTQMPVNPVLFGLGVKDDVPPVMRRLVVYPIGEGSTVNGSKEKLVFQLEKSGRNYRISGNRSLKIKGRGAFGVEAYDQTSGSGNRCGLYDLRLLVDSVTFFSQTKDKFSFNETRCVNSLMDYAYYVENRVRINRLYIEPNNTLSIYKEHINHGVVSFSDSAEHDAVIIASDLHGNESKLGFTFTFVPEETNESPVNILEIMRMPLFTTNAYERDLVFKRPGVKVVIPAYALYSNIDFEYESSGNSHSLYSAIHHIHNVHVPLHKAISIEIAADSLPERLRDKALVAHVASNGRITSAGGAYQDNVVGTHSMTFGNFAIAVDTIPPRIIPINLSKGANMRGVQNIRFKITDDFSGISTYNGWIDDQWVLFEYDAKNDLITYRFDPDRLKRNTKHHLVLKVTDAKNNLSEYTAEFTW